MNLPEGFVLDQQPQTSGALPAGFVLDGAPSVAPQKTATQGESLARGIAQGATFNMADELQALRRSDPNAVPLPAPRDPQNMSADEQMFRSMREGGDSGVLPALKNLFNLARGDKATGGAYEKAVGQERAAEKAAEQANPWTYLAGNIAGGAVMPVGAINSAKQGVKVGAGMGAAYGFGSGEGLTDSAASAASGGIVGGALGGILGKAFGGKGAPAAQNEVVAASERSGVSVPVGVASESQTVQRAGQAVRVVPFAGEAMAKAVGKTQGEATAALDKIAGDLGSGDVAQAGAAAASSIKDWVTGKSKDALKTAYDAVDNHINPNSVTPLSSTRNAMAEIMAQRQAQRISDPGKAVSFVADAAMDAQGLTYQGIKGLRTRIGEMLDNPSMLPAETSKAELKRIYGALTDDLGLAVENAGGAQAKMAWERANTLNKAVQQRREELAKIVGEGGDAAPEKVFSRLQAMASNKSSADIGLLAKARNAIGQEWDEVSSAVVANMGRDAAGEFTPDRFVTAYSKLSESGKSLLFDKATRQALDDINTISARMQAAFKRYGNASGTAQNVGWASSGAGLMTSPVATIASILGGNVLAQVLSRPATASSMAKWSRAYELAVTKPSAATASALNIASRNFASNIADKTGVTVTGEALMKAISGPRTSRGEADQEKRN